MSVQSQSLGEAAHLGVGQARKASSLGRELGLHRPQDALGNDAQVLSDHVRPLLSREA